MQSDFVLLFLFYNSRNGVYLLNKTQLLWTVYSWRWKSKAGSRVGKLWGLGHAADV